MALVSLSGLWVLLFDFQLCFGAPASGPVFLSGQAADSVLQRHKRYNNGVFEELLKGNLERECMEEVCNLEEAREIFENDKQTMDFWEEYEVLEKRCDVNNGHCMHFCESMGTMGVKCSCARGYKLMQDGVKCEPGVEFPCGRTALTEIGAVSRRSWFGNGNASLGNTTSLTNITTIASPSSTPAPTSVPFPPTTDSVKNQSRKKLPLWVDRDSEVPTEEPIRPFKRIVGGEVVIPGEIPWQVALMARPSGEIFCGGSIVSEQWVITAAHCLVEAKGAYFIRVGEHNIYINEGTEQDYDVWREHVHPRYNSSVSLYNHDIALLYLKSPITFSTTVRPICIGPKAFIEALVKESSPATVSGWGRTRFLGFTANTLQKVEVPFTDRTECKRRSSARITRVMFCAGYYNEAKDACQGDSGGPHTNSIHDTWFLTGLVSWGEECAKQGKFGVYTRMSLYYSWMNHVMGLTKHRLAFDVEDPDPEI
ncbi:coagulation factor IXa isoform X2 [Etheostoma cragini]|uniref:coagulation factor IXa isoform X2 n=1 Tax=Etheostoma cragini TaxID=417921 RepID=UPI00155E56B8|nr:coagulation factor IXa isoform X2 [Etheostoma cragini]